MKLTAIRLRNVKKFGAEGLAVEGIANGLSILSAPNEFGKSTLFDAVRVLLLQKHSAKNKDTKALEPLSRSGAPEIEIDVEDGAKRYRIWKRFLSVPKAQVVDLDTGDIVAQDGAADEWVLALIGADTDKYGPVGLLWVEQGTSMSQPEGGENLLSSLLEAEVGTLVGGDRARTYLQRCRDELGSLITSTGKPKTGGAFKSAADAFEEASQKLKDLKDKAASADQLATTLQQTEQKLKSLSDPEEIRRREEALQEAEMAYQAASQSASELAVMEADVATKRREAEDGAQLLKNRNELEAAVAAAEQSCSQAQARVDEFTSKSAEIKTELDTARTHAETAKKAYTDARSAQKVVNAHNTANTAWEKHQKLSQNLDRAREIRTELSEISTKLASNKVTDRVQQQISELAREHDKCQARLDAARPLLRPFLTDTGRASVTIDGQPPEADQMRIAGTTEIALGGFGRIEIETPDPGDALQAFRKTKADLDRALESADCATLEAVSAKAVVRRKLEQNKSILSRELGDIARDGVEHLAEEVAELKAQIPQDFDPEAAQPEEPGNLDQLERERDDKVAAVSRLEHSQAGIREKLAELNADLSHSARQLEDALVAAGPRKGWESVKSELKSKADQTQKVAKEALAVFEQQRDAAPDLATAKLTRDRLRQAKENAAEQLSNARANRERLLGELRGQEAEGIGEQVAEAEAIYEFNQRRVEKLERQIEAMQLLETTLESCQSRLQEAYFKPVQEELQPLLQIVLGNNDIVLSEAYQAEKLRRGDYSETIDMLSGGTREQIAVLTRLAFGRLMARQEKPAPVFLDDALVYCDDDRLGAMFDALHDASHDVQCIVLTCHQRAFSDIGGTQLEPSPWPATANSS